MRLSPRLRELVRRPAAAPPSFALILPDELTGLELVEGIGLVFACSRDAFAEGAKHARSQARHEEDQVERAYLTGRADALTEAVSRTDAAMANLFAR